MLFPMHCIGDLVGIRAGYVSRASVFLASGYMELECPITKSPSGTLCSRKEGAGPSGGWTQRKGPREVHAIAEWHALDSTLDCKSYRGDKAEAIVSHNAM